MFIGFRLFVQNFTAKWRWASQDEPWSGRECLDTPEVVPGGFFCLVSFVTWLGRATSFSLSSSNLRLKGPLDMSSVSRRLLSLLLFGLPAFAGSDPGIRNFDQVDAHVYRGGQPTNAGFQYLAKLGVKTVIDLREADGRAKAEESVVTRAGMKYVNVPMTGLTPPTEAQISRILAILEDSALGSVFVHCRRGADRTGAVIAAYHIDNDKWDSARALKDAMAHGMSFFQVPRQNYIRNFQARTVAAKNTPPVAAPAAATPAVAIVPLTAAAGSN
jgi:tyrosine-protein phosphatase SIW14